MPKSRWKRAQALATKGIFGTLLFSGYLRSQPSLPRKEPCSSFVMQNARTRLQTQCCPLPDKPVQCALLSFSRMLALLRSSRPTCGGRFRLLNLSRSR